MFNCSVHISGTLPHVSAKAFIDSYRETSKAQHYQQYQSSLEQYFQNAMGKNIRQMNVDAESKSFTMKVEANQIQFISDNQNSMKYEYGNDNVPPKRFIQPAVVDTANEISHLMISDAISIYKRNTGIGVSLHKDNFGNNISSNYLNKYSGLL